MFEWLKEGFERLIGSGNQAQPRAEARYDQAQAHAEASPDQLAELRERRATLQLMVNALELQEARFGTLYVPAHISVELRQKRQELAALDAEIARLDGSGGSNAASFPIDQLAHLEASRAVLRQSMFDLELQEARFGPQHTPAHISAELRDKRQRLADLEVEIARLGLQPER